ncbi:DNA-binding transcriptional regulator, XRE-family HTH domain [Hathewaya proteolytica DSM 3090]|uniref:DNA-binding transcriptional regulator, XRE-family HTH domain n=1 Tax=Hathewaya proteolytica DSM 3090 TaxID=1121331 RepID=A0A1M6RD82_9CLOT|nr:helix-turn-helix transcriptional regulator [Hathewaya proteolytica]SHK30307.1 DNA-binding transcriptional regulator, XRE-family HTH domain [Hathewaya proteolytica DSM 3090]
MDLIKIGKFIAELRKEQQLTQEELGNKLGVTNKTISRWETGIYLPPGDVLLSMSQLFSVSINEILSGKRLAIEEYKEAAEENLKQTIKTSSFNLKDRIDFYKKKWLKDHIALMVFLGVIVVTVFVTGLVLRESLMVYASMVLLICFHGYRYNAMMTYVEKKAYGCLENKR